MGTNPHHTSSAGSWTPGASSPLPAELHSARSSAVSVASRQAHPSATGSPGRAGEPEPAASASLTRPSSGGSTVPSSPGHRVLGFIHMQLLLQSLKILIMSHSLYGAGDQILSQQATNLSMECKWSNDVHVNLINPIWKCFQLYLQGFSNTLTIRGYGNRFRVSVGCTDHFLSEIEMWTLMLPQLCGYKHPATSKWKARMGVIRINVGGRDSLGELKQLIMQKNMNHAALNENCKLLKKQRMDIRDCRL